MTDEPTRHAGLPLAEMSLNSPPENDPQTSPDTLVLLYLLLLRPQEKKLLQIQVSFFIKKSLNCNICCLENMSKYGGENVVREMFRGLGLRGVSPGQLCHRESMHAIEDTLRRHNAN